MELPFDLRNNGFREKSLYVAKVALAMVVIGLIFFQIVELLVLLFIAVMVAIFFRGLATFVADHTPLKPKWAQLLVMLLLAGGSYLSIRLMAPSVAQQFDQLTETVPQALERGRAWLVQYQWGRQLLQQGGMDAINQERAVGLFNQATGALGGMVYALGLGFVVLFIGLYLAWSPETYRNGFLHLVPIHRRKRMAQVMDEVGFTLKWWLIGRFIDMAFVGILVWVGLYLLDVPLALILALIAAFLNFIPNIGPFLGAIPALLVGLGNDPETALYIAILFIAVQTLETALVTPLVQQRVIHMPPALTLSVQIILGATMGALGVFMATPIAAGAIVVVKQLYVKDVLGDKSVDQK
jgi:predicted PurR-regulated permease PerM